VKVWVWVGSTDYEGDLDILCLQLNRNKFVYVMESGYCEFETGDQSPDKLMSVCAGDWWLVPQVSR
jgi:hypothetical protein